MATVVWKNNYRKCFRSQPNYLENNIESVLSKTHSFDLPEQFESCCVTKMVVWTMRSRNGNLMTLDEYCWDDLTLTCKVKRLTIAYGNRLALSRRFADFALQNRRSLPITFSGTFEPVSIAFFSVFSSRDLFAEILNEPLQRELVPKGLACRRSALSRLVKLAQAMNKFAIFHLRIMFLATEVELELLSRKMLIMEEFCNLFLSMVHLPARNSN